MPDEFDWPAQARSWIAEVLADQGPCQIEVVRERAWGVSWRVETGAGRYWFKRGHPRLWSEVGLRRLLDRLAAGLVVPVVADDPGRGWMLTRDQGATLAARLDEGTDPVAAYARVAVTMARVQQRVRLADLYGLGDEAHGGLAVFEPGDAVRTLAAQLEGFAALPPTHPVHLSVEEHDRALRLMTQLVAKWQQLDLPDAVPGLGLDHNDLHLGNAFPGPGRGSNPLLSDWGDAVIAHPFASLRALLGSARGRCTPAEMEQIVRAYLAEFGDPARLRPCLDLVLELAVAQRLRAWRLIDDEQAWRDYAGYLVPLWRQIGRPFAQCSVA